VEWRAAKFYPELSSCLEGPSEHQNRRFHALRILSTDDDANIRALLWGLLSEAGHVVDFAKDGEEVFRRLAGRSYDLVILDVNMPKMNGYKVSELLHEKLPNPPKVIIFTGRDLEAERLQFVCSGADAILNKGCGNEKILETIDHLFCGNQVVAVSGMLVAPKAAAPATEDAEPRPVQLCAAESPDSGRWDLTVAGLSMENKELKAGLTDIRRILGHMELEHTKLEGESQKQSLRMLALCREVAGKLEAEWRSVRLFVALVGLLLLLCVLGLVLR
jgi:DNA-binding response OmpR family regulator